MTSDNFSIGDSVEYVFSLAALINPQGIVLKSSEPIYPWGNTVTVQVVNGTPLFERGQIMECKPTQLCKLGKIEPR